MHWTSVVLSLVALLAGPPDPQLPGPLPFELAVRQDRIFGSTNGLLVIDDTGIEFRATDPKRTRRWDYLALKQIRIQSTTQITLDTYEDQGRLRLGADRAYAFDVIGTIPEDLIAFLLARVDRPVVAALMPPLPAAALFRVPVKHTRMGRGSEGALVLYDTGLAYLTDREGQARFWRLRDVYGILALDRYRLQILAYEGGSGETRPFTFELKNDLPAGMYDALWQRVNPPVLRNRNR